MKSLTRYNIKEKIVVKSYPIYKDETVVQIDNAIYIITQEEFKKYINGEIEVFEFNEPSFELEKMKCLFLDNFLKVLTTI